MTYKLICGDAIDILRTLDDESVHCCVTSPPYWGGLRDYDMDGQYGLENDMYEYIDIMVRVFREVKRVLRNDGTLWLNIGDKHCNKSMPGSGDPTIGKRNLGDSSYKKSPIPKGLKPTDLIMIPARVAIALMDSGWYLHNEIIWHKPDPMPESVKNRFTHCHEKVYFFSKSAKYHFNHHAVKEDCVNVENRPNGCERNKHNGYKYKYNGTGMLGDFQISRKEIKEYSPSGWDTGPGDHDMMKHNQGERTSRKQDGTNDPRYTGFNDRYESREKRNGRDLWTITKQGTSLPHYASFPEELCERPILAGCPPGGSVLDPFCGICRSGMVAVRLGCNYIGIDLNPKYLQLGKKELNKVHQTLFS